MYDRLEGEDLHDHEVLEILLFNVCPRINTNPLAHSLLDRFITLSNVFNASLDELMSVKGVGENVANFLKTVGLCAMRTGAVGNAPSLKTVTDCRRFVHVRFAEAREEKIELYFVDKASRVFRIYTFSSGEKSRAAVDIDAIARSIALSHPHGIIVAHNHLEGQAEPSSYDDTFTRMLQFMSIMNGSTLLDHLIFRDGEEIFSYKDTSILDLIKRDCTWDAFERWITQMTKEFRVKYSMLYK